MQHPREVVDMFNEFKSAQTNLLNVKEFWNYSKNLEWTEAKRNENLNLNQFAESFHYDSSDFDNFEMLFQIMDTSNSKRQASRNQKQCDILGMGFSDKDIDIMINQIGSEEQDVVSRDKLWSVLQQYKSHEIHHQ